MTTDRELLELAAKAAGLEYRYNDSLALIDPHFVRSATGYAPWNPLTDYGDEARLESKLGMDVEWYPALVLVGAQECANLIRGWNGVYGA